VYIKGDTMGTFYTVRFWSDCGISTQKLTTGFDKLLDDFESELSNWRLDSWVNQFNSAPAGESVPVPNLAFEVISLCIDLAKSSDGMLDPTISPLIELWDPVNRTLLKTVGGLQVNFSAVAKGFAVDLLAERLMDEGVENFLINIGGEVRAQGLDLDHTPWRVGINQPLQSGRNVRSKQSIELHNHSLATSGHSQRTFFYEGKRYSHILNPKTGQPVSTEIAAATVVATSCALADGLATLALILNETEMDELLESYDSVKVFRTKWVAENITLNN
jgi:thiamine biosynthesis lipoprotein